MSASMMATARPRARAGGRAPGAGGRRRGRPASRRPDFGPAVGRGRRMDRLDLHSDSAVSLCLQVQGHFVALRLPQWCQRSLQSAVMMQPRMPDAAARTPRLPAAGQQAHTRPRAHSVTEHHNSRSSVEAYILRWSRPCAALEGSTTGVVLATRSDGQPRLCH